MFRATCPMSTTKSKRIRPRDFIPGWNLLEYFLLRGLAGIINALPIAYSTWIARRIGDLIFLFMRKRREVALRNLNIAYGDSLSIEEKKTIARESMRNFATSLMEFFRTPAMLRQAKECFEFEGLEILDQAFAKGKGIIFVISHLGAWEYLAFVPYVWGYPFSVVVKETKNPYVFKWIQQLRISMKLNPIPRKKAIKQVLSELKKNHLVAILIDQWAAGEGIAVDFFGKLTSTTSIPVRLAKKTGAALVPGYCLRKASGRYKIVIRPAVAIAEESDSWERQTTLNLNQLLEKEILKYPEQWLWTHRRWKELSH